MKIRAAVTHAQGQDFSIEEVSLSGLQANEVLIKIVATGVDLALLGPLGCGIQTGAGTVLNRLKPEFGTSIAVYGCGAVGLSAIMTAKIAGCPQIFAVDVHNDLMAEGKSMIGVIEGDSVPRVFIPQLVEFYKTGKFPFDKLIKFYDFSEINQAFEDSATGVTVKPVLKLA